mmetsp:Transcript_49965/g.61351  ORF Transcript_49965/g.61351 Transcript_49965/m.61351 type:complete len:161 (+) Transcript_49965:122-604(+)
MLAVKATDDLLTAYNKMKIGGKTAFITMKVKDNDVVIDKLKFKKDYEAAKKKGDADENKDGDDAPAQKKIGKEPGSVYVEDFMKTIKKSGQPRFGVLDFNHKLLFVAWTPDTSKRANKMIYASVKNPLIEDLTGIVLKLQATDDSELCLKEIVRITKSNV